MEETLEYANVSLEMLTLDNTDLLFEVSTSMFMLLVRWVVGVIKVLELVFAILIISMDNVRNTKIGLYFIFILFYFLFLLVYSILRTRARDQWDVTNHSHTIIKSHTIMKNNRKFWKE